RVPALALGACVSPRWRLGLVCPRAGAWGLCRDVPALALGACINRCTDSRSALHPRLAAKAPPFPRSPPHAAPRYSVYLKLNDQLRLRLALPREGACAPAFHRPPSAADRALVVEVGEAVIEERGRRDAAARFRRRMQSPGPQHVAGLQHQVPV